MASKTPDILPAILEDSFIEVRRKIRRLTAFANRIQIDIKDGAFVPGTTWARPGDLQRIAIPFQFEVHLMVAAPERSFFEWLKVGASQLVVHYEAINEATLRRIAKEVHSYKRTLGLAINPTTPWAASKPFLGLVDTVLVMTVEPGLQGGRFLPGMLRKVQALKRFSSQTAITVDGGMNPERARRAARAGATAIVAGSYIWKHEKGPRTAYEELMKAVTDIDFPL